jgi:hypothetical protein
MVCLPIIERELRVALRKRRTARLSDCQPSSVLEAPLSPFFTASMVLSRRVIESQMITNRVETDKAFARIAASHLNSFFLLVWYCGGQAL